MTIQPLFPEDLAARVRDAGIIAVLVVDRVDDAVPLASALFKGGVTVMELTLRTPVALDALRAIRAEVPEMLAGVGTILTPEQLAAAREAGAAFGVSPGVNPRVLSAAREAAFPFAPGVATPSDIETALEHGCRLLKFFPCEPSGGLPYLRAIAAPYAHLGLRYIPLGGVNAANMGDYLKDPLISALGGSWLAPKETVAKGDWAAITTLASEASQKIQSLRIK